MSPGAGEIARWARPVASLKGLARLCRLRSIGWVFRRSRTFCFIFPFVMKIEPVWCRSLTSQWDSPPKLKARFETRLEPGRRRSLFVRVRDTSGQLGLRFYAFNKSYTGPLHDRYPVSLLRRCTDGALRVRNVPSGMSCAGARTHCRTFRWLMPVYPAVEGLAQRRLQSLVAQALDQLRLQPVQDWFAV